MPSGKVHNAISRIRTDKDYSKLHRWMDEDEENRGVNHRIKNHYYSEELRQYVHKNFGGDEAVSEWLFHIALDNLETSIKNDRMHGLADTNLHKFGFCKDGFIYYDEKALDEDELDTEFPEYEKNDWED